MVKKKRRKKNSLHKENAHSWKYLLRQKLWLRILFTFNHIYCIYKATCYLFTGKTFHYPIYDLLEFSYLRKKKRMKWASAMTGKDWRNRHVSNVLKSINLFFWNMSFTTLSCLLWFVCLYNLFSSDFSHRVINDSFNI